LPEAMPRVRVAASAKHKDEISAVFVKGVDLQISAKLYSSFLG